MAFKGGVVLGTVSLNATGTGTTNIGGTSNSGTISIGNGSSGAVTIGSGTAGISVGATANNHTTTLGTTNGTATTNINAGSGGIGLTGVVTSANAITVTTGDITASNGSLVVTVGDLKLPTTTSPFSGVIQIGGNRFIHSYGLNDTFIGNNSGNFSFTGVNNTGCGNQTLNGLSSGSTNFAGGSNCLFSCTTGSGNVGIGGINTLLSLTTGNNNIAIGANGANAALQSITSGGHNLAIGHQAGISYTGAESSNILLQNNGTLGESNVMRLGTAGSGSGQVNQCFIAGITGISTGGASNVTYVDANGKLGTTAGGAITMNTGTNSLSISSDASATTVNIATGAAAKVATLGSTNGASSLGLRYGTADFTLASATGTVMSALDTGEITYPLQPAFLAYNSADDLNVTGDGTAYTVIFDSEIYDQNADYDNATGIFTAPVTGKYLFCAAVSLVDVGAGHTGGFIELLASNRSNRGLIANAANLRTGTNNCGYVVSTHVDMDAADTAKIVITISGSTLTVDVQGVAGGTTNNTWFSGQLIV